MSRGITEAFLIIDFIATNPTVLILGDNIFYGEFGLDTTIRDFTTGAVIFDYPVRNPEQYGVVEVDVTGRVLGLRRSRPTRRSKYAVPGLYVFDSQVVEYCAVMAPSARGEIEITDINRTYLERRQLRVVLMDRGVAWLDSGTHDSLLDAANFVATVEHRQSIKIACLEEIALRAGSSGPQVAQPNRC